MSKIGQKPIEIPSSVTVNINSGTVTIKGTAGIREIVVPENLTVSMEKNQILLKRANEEKNTKSIHGLFRQLLWNAVTGVEKPWEKRLEVVGTGFNVKLQGEDLVFKLGYSHPIVFKKTAGINFKVEGNTKVIIMGVDKQLVGQIAYQIKLLRKPDPYKGKGIRYEKEVLRIKPGKKAKTVGVAVA
jgi:large subunit ribosomal protein L6